jgi:dihydrolipoamide dehydrogenase
VDVVVIGAGPGGYPAAIRAAQLGREVLLIERDRLGGECLNYGCIPSKALIGTGNLVHAIRAASERGVDAGPVKVDFVKLQSWKSGVVERLTGGIAQLCKGNGVETAFGAASFTGPQGLRLRRREGGSEDLTFEHAIVATGGRPSDLPAFAFDGRRVISTKEALELTHLPEHLLVIGGGVSGLEIGTFYAKLGTRVTLVEILDQILPGIEKDIVRIVERRLKKLGVDVHVGSQAKAWREATGHATVEVETPDGPRNIAADVILVTVGRRANTEGLGVDLAGIRTDPKGHVLVDRQMRTSNPRVFAIGDVVGPPYLAHKATMEGLLAAEVVAGQSVEADYRAMPAAIFTDPEIATVGLTEAEASAKGQRVLVGKVPFAAIGRALTMGDSDGFVRIVADRDTKAILGGQIVGPDASDLISELALAIEMGATVEDLALTVHPHPTLPEAIMETAEAALGQAIHILNRT